MHCLDHSLSTTLPLPGPLASGGTVVVTLFYEIMGLSEQWDGKLPMGLVSTSVHYISVFFV